MSSLKNKTANQIVSKMDYALFLGADRTRFGTSTNSTGMMRMRVRFRPNSQNNVCNIVYA
jgi:hypothetical protein